MAEYVKISALLADRTLKAINRRLGIPRRGRNVGRGPHAVIGSLDAQGKRIGWTETEVDLEETEDGQRLMPLTRRIEALDGEALPDADEPLNVLLRVPIDLSSRLNEEEAEAQRKFKRSTDDNSGDNGGGRLGGLLP